MKTQYEELLAMWRGELDSSICPSDQAGKQLEICINELEAVIKQDEKPAPKPQCSSCRFFQRTNDPHGECRRHAPAFSHLPSLGQQVWPTVEQYDWCGEWSAQ